MAGSGEQPAGGYLFGFEPILLRADHADCEGVVGPAGGKSGVCSSGAALANDLGKRFFAAVGVDNRARAGVLVDQT